jgi:signal transduction histidine kinase
MHAVDDDDFGYPIDSHDRLRHELKTPLTTIHGRAQLFARAVRRSPSLTEQERAKLLAGLAELEAAVRVMVARIEAMGRDEGNRPRT